MIQNENLLKYTDLDAETGKRLFNIDAIEQALDNLFSTPKGSLFFNRELGTKIPENLFAPVDFIQTRILRSEIIYAVSRFLSPLELDPSSKVEGDPDNRKYDLDLYISYEGIEDVILINKELKVVN